MAAKLEHHQNSDPDTYTPLAESLYTVSGYFGTSGITGSNGPRYFSAAAKSYFPGGANSDPFDFDGQDDVECCKSFVVLISDGTPTNDSNIPGSPFIGSGNLKDYDDDSSGNDSSSNFLDDVALWAHTTDLRADLDGDQTIELFTVFAFGRDSDIMRDAAVNGGFIDADGDDKPDPAHPSDWDAWNALGSYTANEWDDDADGVPDNYYEAKSGTELKDALVALFNEITSRVTSGTAVSVLASAGEGEGAVYQAFYLPSAAFGTREVTWRGFLRALWVDQAGNLHEEAGPNYELNFTTDKIIRFRYDDALGETVVDRYNYTVDDDGLPVIGSAITPAIGVDELDPIWEAGEILAQRPASERTLYTFIDANQDGVPDPGEFVQFTDSRKTALRPYLRGADDTEAENIINFIRGEDLEVSAGYRDRTVEIGAAATEYEWKLGDIVSSTPVTSAKPRARYDILYGDVTYLEYHNEYKDNDTIVYAGANDGGLHAFYAGKFNEATSSHKGNFTDSDPSSANDADLDIGDEIWMYIPYNLLPHLKWLTRTDYSHVFYVDLEPQTVDAQIFACDSAHDLDGDTADTKNATTNKCWGTMLIGGTGFGGGEATYTETFDGSTNASRSFRPSYFAIDITDPFNPELLWEFSHADLGFAQSYPSIAKVGHDWFLVVGSGTNSSHEPDYGGNSAQQAHIFVLDLKTGALLRDFRLNDNEAFIANPISLDPDFNPSQSPDSTYNLTEALYFGETYKSGANWKGKMYRILTNGDKDPANWSAPSTLFETDNGEAIVVAANSTQDQDNDIWLYFGTGRYFGTGDRDTNQQVFYGIKEPCWETSTTSYDASCTTTVIKSDLYNSTGVVVNMDGTVDLNSSPALAGFTDGGPFASFETALKNSDPDGWYRNFPTTSPHAERSLTVSGIIGGAVLFTTYTPTDNICDLGGIGYLYGFYYLTGTAFISGDTTILGTDADDSSVAAVSVSLGKGTPSKVTVHVDKEADSGEYGGGGGSISAGSSGGTAFIQTSGGGIGSASFSSPQSIRSGIISWKEN